MPLCRFPEKFPRYFHPVSFYGDSEGTSYMSERQYHLRTLARFCLMTSSIVGHLEVINQGPDFFFHSAEVGNGIRAPSRANNIPNGSLDFNFHLLFSGQREIYFAIAYRLLGAPIHSKR